MATPYSSFGWNFFTVDSSDQINPTYPVFDPAQLEPSGHGSSLSLAAPPTNSMTPPGKLVILRGVIPMDSGSVMRCVFRHGDGVGAYFGGFSFVINNTPGLGAGAPWEIPLWNGLSVAMNGTAGAGGILVCYELPR